MASTERDIRDVELSEEDLWRDGPPYEAFRRMRAECPVHRTERFFSELPGEAGFWSVTTAEDDHTVSRDWRTYSSELGGITAGSVLPEELSRAMFIGMDSPSTIASRRSSRRGSRPGESRPTARRSGRSRAK